MSVHQRKQDNLWISAWRESGKKITRAFKDEQAARAFDAERIRAANPLEGLLTLGELAVLFFRSHPDYNDHTKADIVSFLSDGNPAGFMRGKYAAWLNRQDLERMREGFRARETGNNTINKKQAYIRAILAWGADQELIDRNPWRDFKKLPVSRNKFTTTLQDVRATLKFCPEWLRWAVATCYALSLRPGMVELFGLLWSAFDWQSGCVVLKQGKSGKLKTVFPPPEYMSILKIKKMIFCLCVTETDCP
jgi:integrase